MVLSSTRIAVREMLKLNENKSNDSKNKTIGVIINTASVAGLHPMTYGAVCWYVVAFRFISFTLLINFQFPCFVLSILSCLSCNLQTTLYTHSAAKHGVLGFTRSCRILRDVGIRVNAICPSVVEV